MLARRYRVVCCLLMLSASANVWMLVRQDTATKLTTAPAIGSSPDSRQRSASLAPQGPGDLLGVCHRQLVAASQALASATEHRAQQIPARKRFEEGTRQPGMEVRMSPLVEKAVANVAGVKQYPLECRADLCQVRVSAPTRNLAEKAWRALTNDPGLRKDADGFMREGGDPVMDLVTGKGSFDVEMYLFTRSASNATSDIEAFVQRFRASDAVASCGSAGADRGVLEVQLSIVPDGPTLTAAVGGDLAGTAVGKCISNRLSEMVSSFKPPAGTTYGVVYASIVSPHGE